MATEYATAEVWIVIDQDGDYAVGDGEENAHERYAEEFGGDCARGRRAVKVLVRVPLPKPLELPAVTVPEPDESAAGVVA